MALFSVQQENKTVQRPVAFKIHMLSPKKLSLPKGWTDTVHLFSFNAHIHGSNIGAQSLHLYILIYTCIITNLWEPAFVHNFTKALQPFLRSNTFY